LGLVFYSSATEVCTPSYMGDGVICTTDKLQESDVSAGNLGSTITESK
jgi:hypothetical protein